MSKKNTKQAARTIQAECGVKYTTAYQWVRENHSKIIEMIMTNDGINWKEYSSAAAGLWRRNENRS